MSSDHLPSQPTETLRDHPQANEENGSCSICYGTITPEDVSWQCTRCRSSCHLRCTLQWVLRLVMNHTETTPTLQTYTCPVCRASHAISTLPGFENDTPTTTRTTDPSARGASTRPSTSSRSTVALLHLLSGLFPDLGMEGSSFQRTVTFLPSLSAMPTTPQDLPPRPRRRRRRYESGRGEEMDDAQQEGAGDDDDDEDDEYDEEEEEDDDDDEYDDDDEEYDVGALCNIQTRKISININSLTFNYRP